MSISTHTVAMAALLVVCAPVFALGPPVPDEFIGDWTPMKSACKSATILRVELESVSLLSKADQLSFGDLDICYSCEGGVRYSGEVVWLSPDFNKSGTVPFIIRFNANEKKGVTRIEFLDPELKKRFPIENVALRKCGP